MVDWRARVATTDPRYYKWTQWIFLQLYKRGLAVQEEGAGQLVPVVQDGARQRAGHRRRSASGIAARRWSSGCLEQWFFRITKYAERLLDNLDWIDWSETTKHGAAQLDRPLARAPSRFRCSSADASAEVAERSGAHSRLHHAARHPLRRDLHGAGAGASAGGRADDSRAQRARREGVPRTRRASMDLVVAQGAAKEKTGVFTGAYAVNPATGAAIPDLDRRLRADGVRHRRHHGRARPRRARLRVRHEVRPADRAGDRRPRRGRGDTPLAEAAYDGAEGRLVNSGQFDGMPSPRRRSAHHRRGSTRRASAKAVSNYRLHDWCISRQRYWGPPIPMIYCDACGTVPVPETDLPVVLPDDRGLPARRHRRLAAGAARGVVPTCRARTCGGRRAARPTSPTPSSTRAWYFLRYPSRRPRRRRLRPGADAASGCRWTRTSAATSTRCCT